MKETFDKIIFKEGHEKNPTLDLVKEMISQSKAFCVKIGSKCSEFKEFIQLLCKYESGAFTKDQIKTFSVFKEVMQSTEYFIVPHDKVLSFKKPSMFEFIRNNPRFYMDIDCSTSLTDLDNDSADNILSSMVDRVLKDINEIFREKIKISQKKLDTLHLCAASSTRIKKTGDVRKFSIHVHSNLAFNGKDKSYILNMLTHFDIMEKVKQIAISTQVDDEHTIADFMTEEQKKGVSDCSVYKNMLFRVYDSVKREKYSDKIEDVADSKMLNVKCLSCDKPTRDHFLISYAPILSGDKQIKDINFVCKDKKDTESIGSIIKKNKQIITVAKKLNQSKLSGKQLKELAIREQESKQILGQYLGKDLSVIDKLDEEKDKVNVELITFIRNAYVIDYNNLKCMDNDTTFFILPLQLKKDNESECPICNEVHKSNNAYISGTFKKLTFNCLGEDNRETIDDIENKIILSKNAEKNESNILISSLQIKKDSSKKREEKRKIEEKIKVEKEKIKSIDKKMKSEVNEAKIQFIEKQKNRIIFSTMKILKRFIRSRFFYSTGKKSMTLDEALEIIMEKSLTLSEFKIMMMKCMAYDTIGGIYYKKIKLDRSDDICSNDIPQYLMKFSPFKEFQGNKLRLRTRDGTVREESLFNNLKKIQPYISYDCVDFISGDNGDINYNKLDFFPRSKCEELHEDDYSEDDYMPIKELIMRLCGLGRDSIKDVTTKYEQILKFMHCCIVGKKMGVALICHGPQGQGKSTIFEHLLRALCPPGKMVKSEGAEKVLGKFNSSLAGKYVSIIDEFSTVKGNWCHMKEVLKSYITGDSIEIEGKGKDIEQKTNRLNFIVLLNKKHSLDMQITDRRWFYISINPPFASFDDAGHDEYFQKIYDIIQKKNGPHQLNAFYSEVMKTDITSIKESSSIITCDFNKLLKEKELTPLHTFLMEMVYRVNMGDGAKAAKLLSHTHEKFVIKSDGTIKLPILSRGSLIPQSIMDDYGFSKKPTLAAKKIKDEMEEIGCKMTTISKFQRAEFNYDIIDKFIKKTYGKTISKIKEEDVSEDDNLLSSATKYATQKK